MFEKIIGKAIFNIFFKKDVDSYMDYHFNEIADDYLEQKYCYRCRNRRDKYTNEKYNLVCRHCYDCREKFRNSKIAFRGWSCKEDDRTIEEYKAFKYMEKIGFEPYKSYTDYLDHWK